MVSKVIAIYGQPYGFKAKQDSRSTMRLDVKRVPNRPYSTCTNILTIFYMNRRPGCRKSVHKNVNIWENETKLTEANQSKHKSKQNRIKLHHIKRSRGAHEWNILHIVKIGKWIHSVSAFIVTEGGRFLI
jgi:hypothetical protein